MIGSQGSWRRVLALSCAVVGLSLAGCEGADPLGREPISGQVTFDGAPVKQGTIRFESPTIATGAPIVDGAYELPRSGGLTEGSYKVFVSAADGAPDQRTPDEIMNSPGTGSKDLIPAKYNARSELTASVPGDVVDGKLNFALTK